MLLCAGLGVRMQPLTRALPKPAIAVLGRPIAWQNLARLARFGVTTAAVNLHHLPEALPALLGEGGSQGLPALRYTWEDPILGTAGGLRHAAEHLRGDGPFVVHNSDFLSDVDLEAALDTHRRSGLPATLVLAPAREGYSAVDIDGDGRILAIAGLPEPADTQKTAERCLFTGLQILDEEILDRIPPEGASNVVTDVHAPLVTEGRLGAYVHRGFWWEFGNPQGYHEGSMRLLDLPQERLDDIGNIDPVQEVDGARLAVGPGADVEGDVALEGRIALGLGCRVAGGATLSDTIVMPEAWIGPGCSLRRVIVGPGTELPTGVSLESALVCADDDPEGPLADGIERDRGLLIRRF
jgi:NDP-sugar pyrophosphorylase family protein